MSNVRKCEVGRDGVIKILHLTEDERMDYVADGFSVVCVDSQYGNYNSRNRKG
jgi:hypothetical protein